MFILLDICFTPNIKIDINNKQCIESCLNNKYEYELNNICYNECPKDSFPLSDDELDNNNSENIKKCYDKIPEGYVLKPYLIISCFPFPLITKCISEI